MARHSIQLCAMLCYALQAHTKGGKKDDDDFRAFHDHETTAGMVAAGVRLLVGFLFRFALSRTMAVSSTRWSCTRRGEPSSG